MNPCNKSCVDSELIPPAQQGRDKDGRDGRASAVEMVAGETTPTGDKTTKEDNSMSARVNVCVQLRVCVDFCPCGSWKDKERYAMIST